MLHRCVSKKLIDISYEEHLCKIEDGHWTGLTCSVVTRDYKFKKGLSSTYNNLL